MNLGRVSCIRLLKLAVKMFFILMLPILTMAQNSDSNYELEDGTNEWGIWGGFSPKATKFPCCSKLEGRALDERKFGMVGLRYGRVFAVRKKVAYEYTFDLIPLSFVQSPVGTKFRDTVYGFGISPVGFKFLFRPSKKVKPFIQTTLPGIIRFNEQVPVTDGTKWNITFDAGGGIQVFTKSKKSFTLGYKVHHISNGYHHLFPTDSPKANAGLNSHIFYVGFSIFK
jgi:hypothetical protein